MDIEEYKEHVKAKCFPSVCNLGKSDCPVPEYGFRFGAMKDKTSKNNPHPSHCCFNHGCKYGFDDCPVSLGVQKQQYPCESCSWEQEDNDCPCLLVEEPCHPDCTCVKQITSRGCLCCAQYGSEEQRKAAAKRIVETLKSVESWCNKILQC